MDRQLQQHDSPSLPIYHLNEDDNRDSEGESMPGLEPDPDLGPVRVSAQIVGASENNSNQHQSRGRNHSRPRIHQPGEFTSGINRSHRIWQVSDGVDPLEHSLGHAEEDDDHYHHNFPLPSLQYLGPGQGGIVLGMPLPLTLAGAPVSVGPPGFNFMGPANSSRGQEPLFVPGGGLTRPSFRLITAASRQHRVQRHQRGGSSTPASQGRDVQQSVRHTHNINAGSSRRMATADAAAAGLVPDAVAQPASSQPLEAELREGHGWRAQASAASLRRYRVHVRRTRQTTAIGQSQALTSSAVTSEPFMFRATPAADLGATATDHPTCVTEQQGTVYRADARSGHNAHCNSTGSCSSRRWWPPWHLFTRCVRLLHQLLQNGFGNTRHEAAAAVPAATVSTPRPNYGAADFPFSFALDMTGSDASPAASAPEPSPLTATNLAQVTGTAGGRRQRSHRRSAARAGQRRRRGQQHASRTVNNASDDYECEYELVSVSPEVDVYEAVSDSDGSQAAAGVMQGRLPPASAARLWPPSSNNRANSLPTGPSAQPATTAAAAAGSSGGSRIRPSPKRNRTSDYETEAAAGDDTGGPHNDALARPAAAAAPGTSMAAECMALCSNQTLSLYAAEDSAEDDDDVPELENSSSSDGMPELEVSTTESEGDPGTPELSQPPTMTDQVSADHHDVDQGSDKNDGDDDDDSMPQLEADHDDDVSEGGSLDDDSMPDLEGHTSEAVSHTSMPSLQHDSGSDEEVPGGESTQDFAGRGRQQAAAAGADGSGNLRHASGLRRGFFAHPPHHSTSTDQQEQQQHGSTSAPSISAARAHHSNMPPLVDPMIINQMLEGLFTDRNAPELGSSYGSDADWETASGESDDLKDEGHGDGRVSLDTEEMMMRLFEHLSQTEEADQHLVSGRSRAAANGAPAAANAPPYRRQRSNGFVVPGTSNPSRRPAQAQHSVGSSQADTSRCHTTPPASTVVKGLPALSRPNRTPLPVPATAAQQSYAAPRAAGPSLPEGMLSAAAAKAKKQQLSTLLSDSSYSDDLLHSLSGVNASDSRIVSVMNLLKGGRYELAATATTRGANKQWIAYEDMMFNKRLQTAKQMAWKWRS